MSILFTQNFDIIQEKEEEYGEFIAQTYVPQMNAMGLASVGGYYVEIGFGPRVIGVHASRSLDELSRVLTSKEYKELALGLKSFVYNYRNAAMEPLGKIKQEEYTIQKNVWKLNQYYDLRPGMKEAYKDFIINEHLPAMSRIDYVEVTGGWNVILGGVSEIIAEFTVKDPIDIGRLMNNEDFRTITLKLRNRYIRNYASRVLRCTERFDEPRWFRL
ncbi:MAG: hypothetical protein A4E58_02599 [Syntrophorhabdus sp. PtaB.Bin006]|nr:MAG: hypothetical protein A4E58_02599 [Syntrophorhabdus sp. PtaB.Bin006]